jgi:hypothetical protein
VVAEVARPYDATDDRPALLPGTFADVTIFGRTIESVVELPRFAIHDGDLVWVYVDGVMDIREVEIARADRERSLIRSGLDDGDLVVLTSLDAVTDGMALRIEDDEIGTTKPPSEGESSSDQQATIHPASRVERIAGGAA